MKAQKIEMFSGTERIVHWLHTTAFFTLIITGALLFMPLFHGFIQGNAGVLVRIVHRIGAIAFMLCPLLFLIFDFGGVVDVLKRITRWGSDDLGWLKAAPRYYFLGDKEAMPPQDRFNTGQKLFYLLVVVCMAGFIITGLVMWFGKGTVSPTLFLWSVLIHDICTITYGTFFLVHLVLSVIHPMMSESINAMVSGKVSAEYVKKHHGRYYDELMS